MSSMISSVSSSLGGDNVAAQLGRISSNLSSASMAGNMYILFWSVVLLVVALLSIYIYIKFFHSVTFRLFQISKTINLEPENRHFCQSIGKCVQKYNSTFLPENILNYDSNIESNLYFFKNDKYSSYNDAYSQINSFLTNEVGIPFTKEQSYPDEEYELKVASVVNTRFAWSSSDKITDKYKELKNEQFDDKFFKHIDQITDTKILTDMSEGIENSILTFIDTENLEIESFNKNSLIQIYGSHLNTSIQDMFSIIQTKIEKKKIAEKNREDEEDENSENDKDENSEEDKFDLVGLSNVIYDPENQYEKSGIQVPIPMLMDDIIERITRVIYTHYGIDEDQLNENVGENEESKCENKEPVKENIVDKLSKKELKEYEFRMNFINFLKKLKESYVDQFEESKNEKDLKLFEDNYLFVDKFLNTSFNSDGLNMFNELEVGIITANYQRIMDLMYIHTHKDVIEMAILFTMHYIIDTDENKIEKLQLLSELYVSHFELCMYNNEYKSRLDRYNFSRKPNVDGLNNMYDKKKNDIVEYFFKGPLKEFDILWGDFRRPPNYKWVLNWLRQYLDIRKIPQMIMSVFKEGFTQHEEHFIEGKDEDKQQFEFDEYVEERFVSKILRGFKKILMAPLKPFLSPIIAVGQFFMALGKVLPTLLNPMKLLQFIGKLILVIILIVPMLIYSAIPISSDLYGPGEILFYTIVLIIGMLLHNAVGCFLWVKVWLVQQIDVTIPHAIGGLSPGWLYIFLYRFFGACENEPNAWYNYAGYHYGNKNERKFWAYHRCGEGYGPEKKFSNLMCSRKLMQEPKYCPRANIYRLRTTKKLKAKQPMFPGKFYPDLEFINGSLTTRKSIIKNFKKMKYNFYNHCESSMSKYDNITKTICKNYDKLDQMHDIKTLKKLCYNHYCTNGKRDMFCYKLTGDAQLSQTAEKKSIVYRFIFVFVYISILSMIVNNIMTKF
jgi:hypothetical protein